MYFRIIVKQNGAFLFRTSKITDPVVAANIANHIKAGFVSNIEGEGPATMSIEILQVTGSPQGAIIEASALFAIAAEHAAG